MATHLAWILSPYLGREFTRSRSWSESVEQSPAIRAKEIATTLRMVTTRGESPTFQARYNEILPKEEGKEVRETYIVYESLERAFLRIRAGEYPPDINDRKKRQALKLAA